MTEMMTPTEAMMKEALNWLEVVVSLPDGSRRLEQALLEAERGEDIDPARMIALAYGALTIIDAGQAGTLEPWYRERAMSLLCRAMDGLALTKVDHRASSIALN